MFLAFIVDTHSGGPYMYIEKYSNEIVHVSKDCDYVSIIKGGN